MTAEWIEALSGYLISQGLAESVPGYGHATGPQVAEAVAAFMELRHREDGYGEFDVH